MRWWIVLGLLGCLPLYADRVLEIPTGRAIYPERLRLEAGFLARSPEQERLSLHWRLLERLELYGERTGFDKINLYGAQYTLLPELPGYAPGVSIGVSDLGNRTPEGRGYYLALSYGLPALGETPLDHDLRVHLGFGIQGMPGFFIGFEIPLNNSMFLLAEHTGRHLNAGLAWSPTPNTQLRVSVIRQRTVWSLVWRLWEE